MDEREPETRSTWRVASCRPLWLGLDRHDVFFASTRSTLELVERALRIHLRMREVAEGRLLHLVDGAIAAEERWQPDRATSRTNVLPAVRAPHEGEHCVRRLAALAAWA